MSDSFDKPILFLLFNRAEPTRRVFERIRAARPRRLYIAADGPRAHVHGEAERCAAARAAAGPVDWPCEVQTLFRDTNLGCRRAVSSAISWFFDHEEEGVILEDDCLPDPSFFTYCRVLLEKYRNDTRVMHIGGDNFQDGRRRGDGSYYCSRYCHVWGWASWRRAWRLYDAEMKNYPLFLKQNILNTICSRPAARTYWRKVFDRTARGEIDTWDYQWMFSIWCQNGMSLLPNVNLVANIGFGSAATHTAGSGVPVEAGSLTSLQHPSLLVPDGEADDFTFLHHYLPPLKTRVRNSVLKVFR